MNNITKILITVFAFLFIFVSKTNAYVRVRSYFKSSGTYVQSHYRTNSNSYKFDNWSYKGNVNPFNGRRGYAY